MNYSLKDNPIFYLGILITIEQAIGQGSVSLAHVIPDSWSPYVTGWCTLLAFVGTTIMTALAAPGRVPAGPVAKGLAILAVAALLALMPGAARAQQGEPGNVKAHKVQVPVPLKNPLDKLVSPTGANDGQGTALDQFVAKVQQLSLADFQYALALSKASGNTVTQACWQAWVDILTKQQAKLTDAQGQPITMPDPHLVTNLEIASEWVRQLQPDSAISTGCAPLAQAAQKDVGTMIGAVVTGGALGLLKLPFAVP